MREESLSPARAAAKKTLIPFLEILTYALLALSFFAALYLQIVARSEAGLEGAGLAMSVWFYNILQYGLLAVSLFFGFVSLLILPFKKKLWILAAMILVAFLTRGLF
jgi:hypothetical protein